MKIAANKVVTIDYTVTDENGTVLDSTSGSPLVYLQGAGSLLPALEKALEGRAAGDEVTAVFEPKDAYGVFLPELLTTLHRSAFEGSEQVTVGARWLARISADEVKLVTVRGIDGDNITVDTNHPLAGNRPHFAVKVLAVRDATDDETAGRQVAVSGV